MKTPAPLRIGVLGLTHDHVWSNLRELARVKGAALVAAADPNPPLLDQVRRQFNCHIYPAYDEMLQREDLDAVYVFSDNATGVELTQMAAARRLHVLIEKPLAATLPGADRILAAVRQAKVRLMVSWPFAWWPQLEHAIALAQKGDLGHVWQVKYRAAHAGPREMGCSRYFCEWLYNSNLNGAGALIDYCCYGAVLARCLLGMPTRVTAVAGRLCKEDILVEDNALIAMSYPRAMAVAEASWSQIGHLSSYVTMIYGTKATLRVEPHAGANLIMATGKKPDGIRVKPPKQPPHLGNASAHFVHCLQTGEPFCQLGNDRLCRDAQEILEAGLISAREGRSVALPLARF